MSQLIITSYWIARECMVEFRPRFVLSIMGPASKFSLPQIASVEDHETVWVHDITSDDIEFEQPYVPPSLDHVKAIVDLASCWGSSGPVLIHCMAGVSRSSAAGLIYLATLNPSKCDQAASWLRSAGPWLSPNPLMIRLGDQVLNLEGRLIKAHSRMADARMKGVMEPVVVPIRM